MAIEKKTARGFNAAEYEASVNRIPTGSNNPAPAADGLDGGTDLSRNVNNSLNALGGMGVVASVPLKAAKAGTVAARGMMNAAPVLQNGMARLAAPAAAAAPDFIAGATGVAKAGGASLPSVINSPVSIPIAKTVNVGLQEGAQANQLAAITRGFSGASAGLTAADAQQSAPAIAAPPGAAVAATTPADTNPYASVTPEQGAAMAKVNAVSTPAATPAAPVNPNLVTRVGNSYSGGPNISGDIELAGTRGGMISAQNNQAAENLARAGGQTRGFGPSGAIRGGGQVSSMDTSAGFAADQKQLADIQTTKAEQNASMQSQADYAAMKAGYINPKAYQAILARNQADATARRGQDIQSTSVGFTNKLAQEKLGLEKAKDGRDATAAGFTSRAAKRVEDLQAAYESAKPEDKAGIAEQLRVLTGGAKAAQDEYIMANGGQMIDPGGEQFNPSTGKMEPRPSTGQVINSPQIPINKRTGLPLQQGQGQQSTTPKTPPVAGEVRSGFKFKGGDFNDKANWVKI